MKPTSRRRFVLRTASFQSYLLARRSQIVGRPGCEDACPVAHWLSWLFGCPCEVSCDGYQLGDADTLRPLPAWVQAFVRAIDFTFPFDEVTGEQALALLDLVMCEGLGNGPARPDSLLIPFGGEHHAGPIAGVLL